MKILFGWHLGQLANDILRTKRYELFSQFANLTKTCVHLPVFLSSVFALHRFNMYEKLTIIQTCRINWGCLESGDDVNVCPSWSWDMLTGYINNYSDKMVIIYSKKNRNFFFLRYNNIPAAYLLLSVHKRFNSLCCNFKFWLQPVFFLSILFLINE